MTRSGATGMTTVLFFCFHGIFMYAQNIAVFTSVEPVGQSQTLVIPATHAFQLLAQFGDSLADGSTLKTSPDFTAYVPRFDRNDIGYLSLNHEIGSQQGGVTVFDLKFDNFQRVWNITNGLPIDFSSSNGTSKPCSGGITPWGTVVYGEEAILPSDLDSNLYYDAGWLVEVRPATRQVIQKVWKAGNAIHENCVVSADQKTVYWGADDLTNGFVFKYIAAIKKQLSEGKLYVLVRDSSTASTGTWLQVPNSTPEQCNNINAFCQANGAWNFSGVEDVEIGPYGKVYFASKYSGRIWRFKDHGPTVSALEVFVENTTYPIQTESGIKLVQWGIGADNLAFDNANNLWVLQDGGSNYIWMVKPSHTATHPNVSLFGTTPAGSEPTGITFTPNKRFMFLSFQHPNASNDATILDVRGKPVVFNRGTTIVIARKEFLGINNSPKATPQRDSIGTKLNLSVSPNPTNSGVVLLSSDAFENGKAITIVIFDAAGRICHTSKQLAEYNRVSLTFQAKKGGFYRIMARVGTKSGITTLVVE